MELVRESSMELMQEDAELIMHWNAEDLVCHSRFGELCAYRSLVHDNPTEFEHDHLEGLCDNSQEFGVHSLPDELQARNARGTLNRRRRRVRSYGDAGGYAEFGAPETEWGAVVQTLSSLRNTEPRRAVGLCREHRPAAQDIPA